ncbi:MAG: hypothetical protein HYV63_02515 [Candidatus Schekmanbacteria bacterium]|nr:hypothetical protein [Candidatus Schekmanbacteria bacterium]
MKTRGEGCDVGMKATVLLGFGLALLLGAAAQAEASGFLTGKSYSWSWSSPKGYLYSVTDHYDCTDDAPSFGSAFTNNTDDGYTCNEQQGLYAAFIAEPSSKSSVEYLVLIFNGQSISTPDSAWTGQDGDYNTYNCYPNCYVSGSSNSYPLRYSSYARRLYVNKMGQCLSGSGGDCVGSADNPDPVFPWGKTLFISIFDHAYDYGDDQDVKTEKANTWFNWIKGLAYPENLKGIYMLGMSRGGCLVQRLSNKLKDDNDWDYVPMQIAQIDPVCTPPDEDPGCGTDNETGIHSNHIENPDDSSKKCHQWDMSGEVHTSDADRRSIRITAWVTGEQVGPDALTWGKDARCSTTYYQELTTTTGTSDDRTWSRRYWRTDLNHSEIGREVSMTQDIMDTEFDKIERYMHGWFDCDDDSWGSHGYFSAADGICKCDSGYTWVWDNYTDKQGHCEP